jgi:TRAP-type C4-dicarboxylate transport system permease small subunit
MPPTTNITSNSSALTNAPLNEFLTKVEAQILVPLVTLMALAAFVVFLWGVIEYIRNADNDEARTKGQQHILWGFVGLVIIFGTTAIISIIQAFVNLF